MLWKKCCDSLKKSRAIENIPANELELLLSNFFISVRKRNGTEYEPGTLSGLQQCFQRCFLIWQYNKHLINRAKSVCMRESWPRSLVQTSLRLVCNGDLGQDSLMQTSRSVNKNVEKQILWDVYHTVIRDESRGGGVRGLHPSPLRWSATFWNK